MKFSINIKKYALLISLMLIPFTAKPIHSTAAQRILSNITTCALLTKLVLTTPTAQKLLSKFCTALSWGIAAGPSFYEGAKRVQWLLYDEKKYLDQLEDESPEVTHFVREVLKERGVPNSQTIVIKKILKEKQMIHLIMHLIHALFLSGKNHLLQYQRRNFLIKILMKICARKLG